MSIKEQKNWRECIADSLILEGLISFNLPFPKHFPTILFWVPFYSNYYIFGVFLFIPCCGFFSPEIMQDSEHPVLRLSGKTTVYSYDKNITNKIHKKCHECHISDPGGYPLWIPTWEWNEQLGELKFQGYFKKDAICFPNTKQQQIVFSPSLAPAIQNIKL